MKQIVLLADNNDEIREVYGRILRMAEYDVKLASNPQQAREILTRSRINIAVLDVRLEDDDDPADLSGLNIAIDHIFHNIPKVMLTGYKISPEDLRTSHAIEEIPDAAWVGKDEGPEKLIEIMQQLAFIWPQVQILASKVSEQIKNDHEIARKQAKLNYRAAFASSVVGFLLIVAGILLAWFHSLEIGIVGATSGIVTEILGYLFFRRVDLANDRMDSYHRELVQTYWLELLVLTCDQLPPERQARTVERVINSVTDSWYSSSHSSRQSLPKSVEPPEPGSD
jgi:CheY-like chemotaxis protein